MSRAAEKWPNVRREMIRSPMRFERVVHALFDVSVITKGIDSALEILGGALLFFVRPDQLLNIVRILTQHELSEVPHDVVANYLFNSLQHLSPGSQTFAAMYLVWHGAAKLMLVIALLMKKVWAYPAAVMAFGLFIIYQLYRYTHTHAPALLFLSCLDLLVITMICLEYKRLRQAQPAM
jgi:uncharacterized membrane protein